ncbi:hypothetical protein PFISCL1PPCAC_2809, partial [Pristionchus fissidentatus]
VLFIKRNPSVLSFRNDDDIVERLVAEVRIQKMKRHITSHIGDSQEVCKTIVKENYQPKHGHTTDGSRVEIQQDSEAQFVATYRECGHAEERAACTGIDTKQFTSSCVQVWENRKASIRPIGSSEPFSLGDVRVPVGCSCRVRQILAA